MIERHNYTTSTPNPDTMTDFDVEDGTDAADVMSKISLLKLQYNQDDVKFWFKSFVNKLTFMGVMAQYTKHMILMDILPMDVINEVKQLANLTRSEADNKCYKTIKDRILEFFGPNEEDDYNKTT